LGRWSEWAAAAPDEVTSLGRLLQVPPLPFVPEPLRGRSFVGVEAACLGSEADGHELIAPLRELEPEMDTFAPIPPAGLAALHMDPPDPVAGVGDHVMLTELTPAAIDALLGTAGPGSGSPLVSVEVRRLGGALAAAPADAGALPNLDGGFALYGVGMATDPEAAAAARTRLEALRGALAPWASGRRLLNFVERPIDPAEGFSPDAYARLRELKARYDPDGVFGGAHAISPG
jgi:Berberine and berberine like